MAGVQFGQQIDMNGFKVTELAPGTAGTDAVNVDQLNSAVDNTFGFTQTVGDGTNTLYTVTHNLNDTDVIVQVFALATGQSVMVDIVRTGVNAVTVEFGSPVAANSHRVLVLPVVTA